MHAPLSPTSWAAQCDWHRDQRQQHAHCERLVYAAPACALNVPSASASASASAVADAGVAAPSAAPAAAPVHAVVTLVAAVRARALSAVRGAAVVAR